MTTKRKAIMKAIALSTVATIDDLMTATGLQRKNLQDNLKACLSPVQLLERIRDDVTGQPAYKLTKQGRAWLDNDKDDSSTKKPHAQVGDNSASKDKGSHVVGGETRADPLPLGNAVKTPPKPDKKPVAAGADEIKAAQREIDAEVRLDMAGRSIVEFCEWLGKKANVRCPLNLHEAKAVVTDLMQANDLVAEHEAMAFNQAKTIKALSQEIDASHERIAALESNAELPLQTQMETPRYIITDSYTIAKNESEANDYAIKLAKESVIDTPVAVFSTHKARELRINWRDA